MTKWVTLILSILGLSFSFIWFKLGLSIEVVNTSLVSTGLLLIITILLRLENKNKVNT